MQIKYFNEIYFALCDTPINQFNILVANKQGSTDLDLKIKNLSLSLYIIPIITLSYLCCN